MRTRWLDVGVHDLAELTSQRSDLIDQLSNDFRTHGLLATESLGLVQRLQPGVGQG